MRKIAVAGGTGFVGKALVKSLLQHNYQIVIISRNKATVRHFFAEHVTALTWDATDAEVKNKLTECHVIINLAGENISAKRWNHAFQTKLKSNRMNIATQLTQWLSLLAKKPRVFVASALSVYGIYPGTSHIYCETDKTHNNSFLSDVALTLESAYQPLVNSGHQVCFLRFGLVMDSSGGVLKQLILPTKLGLSTVMGSGKQPWSWIGRKDLVNAILLLIKTKPLQSAYNCVNPHYKSQKAFINELAKTLHRPRMLWIPGFILKLMLGRQMATELLLSGTAAIPKNLLDMPFDFQQNEFKQLL